jgi:hypothetical protein
MSRLRGITLYFYSHLLPFFCFESRFFAKRTIVNILFCIFFSAIVRESYFFSSVYRCFHRWRNRSPIFFSKPESEGIYNTVSCIPTGK